jgi:hypothetical protein
MDGGCGDESDDDHDSWDAGGMADQPVSKTEVADFKAQQAKFAAERAHFELQERKAKVEFLRAYDARVKTSLQTVICFRTTSLDVQAMVVGHSGGQILLDFDYGKQVPFPTACCVACPWRTWYVNEESDDDGAPLSGDEAALLAEEAILRKK